MNGTICATQPRTVPLHYVNVCEIEMGPFDCLVRLGIKQDRSDKGTGPNDILCDVLMSPQHVKSMVILLGRVIDQYESQFGPVGIPELAAIKKAK